VRFRTTSRFVTAVVNSLVHECFHSTVVRDERGDPVVESPIKEPFDVDQDSSALLGRAHVTNRLTRRIAAFCNFTELPSTGEWCFTRRAARTVRTRAVTAFAVVSQLQTSGDSTLEASRLRFVRKAMMLWTGWPIRTAYFTRFQQISSSDIDGNSRFMNSCRVDVIEMKYLVTQAGSMPNK